MSKTILLAALAIAVCACGRSSKEAAVPTNTGPQAFAAYHGGREVLRFKEGPGPLRSSALLPVGVEPTTHPFLTASANVPEEENALHDIMVASKSYSDFVERLKKAGYDVRPTQEQP